MSKAAGASLKLKTARLKMQSHRETTLNSCVTRSAGAFVLAVVLGGCGGGGGGASPGVRPNFSYPTLSNAVISSANGGVTSNYSLTGNALTSQIGSVIVSLNSPPQSLSITVTGIASEPAFGFTVNNPAALGLLTNSPLDALSSPCITCLRAGTVTASDGKTVSLIYLDPSSASAALTYSTLGLWSKPTSLSPGNPDVGAAFSVGVVTRPQDLPIFGTANYNGFMVGRYADGAATYVAGANANATASFTLGPNSSVIFSTSNTVVAQEGIGGTLAVPVAQPGLNLNGTLTYSSGSNSLTGPLTAPGVGAGGVMNGTANARYYGPPSGAQAAPAEFGGAFFISNSTQQMNGSFALKKLP